MGKHLVVKTSSAFPFLISITVLLCSGMVLIENNPDYNDSDILFQKIVFGISIVATIITFIIMWRSRYYQED